MRGALKAFFLLFISIATLQAQDRGRPSSDGGSGGGGSSIAGRGTSSGTMTSSVSTAAPSRDYGTGSHGTISTPSFSTPAGRGYAYSPAPSLGGSSFQTLDYYYSWQNFVYQLQTQYGLNSYYFRRFYRNSEPLVTPAMMKLAVRAPLILSNQLLTEVDQLQEMLTAAEAGKPVDKKAVAEKTQVIRDLARKIRRDQSLEYLDGRNDKDLTQGVQAEALGLAAVGQLRQWAVDLNTQLKGLYQESETSTVSVQSLAQPSFEALAKGIEKMSRVIESRSRKL